MRCKEGWIDENRHIKPASIHFPDQSVNRERYSKTYDVLLPCSDSASFEWLFWGVAAVRVDEIPRKDESKGGTKFEFTVEHDPVEDNYGHTELRVYKNGSREKRGKVSELVKKAYRAKVAMHTRIVMHPLV